MKSRILKDFLNIYWLRPETAVFRSIDAVVMKDFVFQSPSLDFGCGDGLFSFLRAGGNLDPDFPQFYTIH